MSASILLRSPSARRLAVYGLAALLACGSLACNMDVSVSTSGMQPEIARAVTNVYPALVRIYVVMNQPSGGRMRKMRAAGSGAIISSEGYVVTNHHVAGNASRIVCSLADLEEIDAELVGTDALADIAVLKLNLTHRKDPSKPLPVATWGDSDKVRVGDVVFAMGSPAAVSQSVTRGIVSNTQLILPGMMANMFRLDGESVGSIVRWLAHDAVIFGGNSGGPLVNTAGQIIGINEIGLGSLSGAIPGNLARSVAEQIIEVGHVKRSWTGMEVQPRLKSGAVEAGVLVAGIVKDSPASKAGIRAGDVVTHFDGAAVDCDVAEQLPLFNQLVLGTPIGKTAEVKLLRAGEDRTVKLTTVAREPARPKPAELKSWGITARNLSRMMALERRRPDQDGVLVGSTRAGGPCGQAKPAIGGGDVIRKINGKAVKDLDALRKLTAEATKGSDKPVEVLVDFDRGTQKLMTVVKVGKEEKADKPARARKPWPAVATQVLTKDLATSLGLKGKTGVRVTQVYPDRAAAKAGLKVGDVILDVDGTEVEASQPSDSDVFETMIRQYDIGAEVVLGVVRGKKRMKVTLTLEAPPTPTDRLPKVEDEDFEFTARNLSAMDRIQKKEDASLRGVLIQSVESGGWASFGGLVGGDVLISVAGKPTADVDALQKVMTQVKTDKPRRIVFFIKRGIHTVYKEIEPDWRALER